MTMVLGRNRSASFSRNAVRRSLPEGHRDDEHRDEIEHREVRDLRAPDNETDERL
jgi:hypothetical protein